MSMTLITFSDIDLLAFSVFLKKRGGHVLDPIVKKNLMSMIVDNLLANLVVCQHSSMLISAFNCGSARILLPSIGILGNTLKSSGRYCLIMGVPWAVVIDWESSSLGKKTHFGG